MARAQIEVEINEVKRIAVPTSGLACKHRLRKDPLRSWFSKQFHYEGSNLQSPTQNIYAT
jgi:hypothetical protein